VGGDRDPSRPAPGLNAAAARRAPTRKLNAGRTTLAVTPPSQDHAMNAFSTLPERAMRVAGQVGDGLRDRVPDGAMKWVETGAALAAAKTGGRVATAFVRRNPGIMIAAAAGAGLLWMAARKRRKRMEAGEAIEGQAKRVEARRTTRSKRTSDTAQTSDTAAS